MRLALVLHPTREIATDLATSVARTALDHGFEVSVDPDDAGRVPGTVPRGEDGLTADIVVAVGGDGTVLEAAHRALGSGLPVIGVNAGNVGFLAEVQPDEVDAALQALAAGAYTVTERMTLRGSTDGTTFDVLNDVVVEKDESQHIVRIKVFADDEALVEYRADGVIVGTPTGSTAYNFSAGGPLIDPELEAVTVTAVAPHTLFGRPLVFGPETTLRLEVAGARAATLNGDGRDYGTLEPGDSVEIARGPDVVRLIRLNPEHFATAIKRKFHLHDA